MTEEAIQRIERIAKDRPITRVAHDSMRDLVRAARERNLLRNALLRCVEATDQKEIIKALLEAKVVLEAVEP